MSLTRTTLCVFLAAVVAACSGGGGGGPAALTAVTIDESGGAVVAAGALAGVVLDIPAGALDGPTEITVAAALYSATPGFQSVGPAVTLRPRGLQFNLPVTLTLPYNEDDPFGSEVVVTGLDSTGDVIELGPAVVGMGFTVAVDISSLSTYWASERFFGGFQPSNYLPLNNNDNWNFENGVTVTMEQSTTEPNLGGTSVFKMVFSAQGQDFGLYLQRNAGATEILGQFSTVGSQEFQQLHDATVFLPNRVIAKTPVIGTEMFDGYEPFGATESTYSGTVVYHALVEKPAQAYTILGLFTDVVRLTVTATFSRTTGEVQQQCYCMTLARDVGPIRVEVLGPEVRLEDGRVGGSNISAG